ncbi:hypothetical protein [Tranquillimonas rosea]|uniref:hypothetical protein n=1 Tax=Tranquillimonas rosea TaxID=641238 RepID=UPI003BAA4215
MAKVVAWPPVGLTAWELTKHHPIGRSRSYFGKPSRISGAGAARYLATATVTGIGADAASSGYVEMLKDQLGFGPQLVRVPSMAPLWHLHARGRYLVSRILGLTAGGDGWMLTTNTRDTFVSDNLNTYGTPTTDNGWPAVRVEGLPPGAVIRPSEFIVMRNGEDGVADEPRRVLTLARADAFGWATIRLDQAFTFSGLVSIGERRDVVFQALDIPRAVQPVSGSWSFEWRFREVFEHEFSDGFQEVDPWR